MELYPPKTTENQMGCKFCDRTFEGKGNSMRPRYVRHVGVVHLKVYDLIKDLDLSRIREPEQVPSNKAVNSTASPSKSTKIGNVQIPLSSFCALGGVSKSCNFVLFVSCLFTLFNSLFTLYKLFVYFTQLFVYFT